MGNRAIVKFGDDKFGAYLHWNGGPESVTAFLQVMTDRNWVREDYACARFIAVVGEYFDGDGNDKDGLSLGICDDIDAWRDGLDNGVYEVERDDNGWVVKQNGKKLKKLTKDQLNKCNDIVRDLTLTRQLRTKGA